jgi:transcriptional regulator with XRE-family HTH domain
VSPVSVSSIGEYIRQQREQAKISLRQLASAAGVSNPYLSQVERGLRRPSAEILQQIAKGLRISAEALYVQAGILEDRRPDSGVRAAVLADPELAERQKQVLLEIYESFRRETALDGGAPGGGPNAAAGEPAEGAAAGAESPGAGPGSVSPGPAGTVARGRRRTGSTSTGSARRGSARSGGVRTGSAGTGSTGTGVGPGAGPALATGQAVGAADGAGDRPGGTNEKSTGADAPAHSQQGPAARQARKGEIRK